MTVNQLITSLQAQAVSGQGESRVFVGYEDDGEGTFLEVKHVFLDPAVHPQGVWLAETAPRRARPKMAPRGEE